MASWRSMMKIAGSGSGSIIQRHMDPRTRCRIHTKMSWIRSTCMSPTVSIHIHFLTRRWDEPWPEGAVGGWAGAAAPAGHSGSPHAAGFAAATRIRPWSHRLGAVLVPALWHHDCREATREQKLALDLRTKILRGSVGDPYFLDLPDPHPDPLVTSTDSYPDLSIVKQK